MSPQVNKYIIRFEQRQQKVHLYCCLGNPGQRNKETFPKDEVRVQRGQKGDNDPTRQANGDHSDTQPCNTFQSRGVKLVGSKGSGL